MKSITIQAPGKLMLMGDHAVVYGHPCLVTSVGTYLTVTITEKSDGAIEVIAPQVSDTHFVDESLKQFVRLTGKTLPPLRIETASSFSGVYGFGSSAAVTAAVIKALGLLYAPQLSTGELFAAAYETVLAVQGVGSGFDVASALFGGTILYTKGGKILEKLTNNVPLVIAYSGVKANTVALIKQVAELREHNHSFVEGIFDEIHTLVEKAKEAIEGSDWATLGKYFKKNQQLLKKLGVSLGVLDTYIQIAEEAGAYGAKLSGAGGGDCMIAVVSHESRNSVIEALRSAGAEVIEIPIGVSGATAVTTDNQNEEFIVVNENDEIIGYKSRKECHSNPSFLHRTIGIVVTNSDGKILLQKRSMTKDTDPGLWNISVAGHVSRNQTDHEAALRELQEELGVTAPLTFFGKWIVRSAQESERAAVYNAVHNGPFYPNNDEVAEVKFFSRDEIQKKSQAGELLLTAGTKVTLHKFGVL